MKKGLIITIMIILSILLLGLASYVSFKKGVDLGEFNGRHYREYNMYDKQRKHMPRVMYIEETDNKVITTVTLPDGFIDLISIYTADESGKLISHVDKAPVMNKKHFDERFPKEEYASYKYVVEDNKSYGVVDNDYMPANTKAEYIESLKESAEKQNQKENTGYVYVFVK